MATEYFNDAWRIPNNKNQSKVSNYSMEFDNVANNSISLGNTLTNGFSELTVSVWANFSSLPGALRGLISKDLTNQRSFEIRYNTGGVNFIVSTNGSQISSSSVYPKSSINIGQWYHFVGVYDGSNILFYVDGTLIGTPTALTGSLQNTTSELNIGLRSASSTNSTFDGKIDQVSIFDYALPATGTNSVATLYGGGTAVTNPMSLSPKPVAYYQLGDQSVSTGPSADYLVPNNSLQDYVFDFDGTDDYIDFINGSTMARGQEISYSVWANLDSFGGEIIGNKNSSNLGTGLNFAAGNLIFQLGDGSNDSWNNSRITLGNYVNTGEWFHIIGTFDGTNAKIYINGVERNNWTPTQPFTISGWNNNFQIGKRADQVSSFMNGRLSNVAFWNSGLTLSQVTTIYNNGSPADISLLNPVSWWKLNAQDTFDGTDWTIKDYAGSNDGTSSGMTSANLIQSNLQHTSGYSPYALSLDGVDDYLNAGSASYLNGLSEFSISVWINLPTAVDNKNIISDWNYNTSPFGHFALKTWNTSGSNFGLLLFIKQPSDVGSNGVSIPAVLTQGNWHNVVFSYDSGTVTCYVDGSVVAVTVSGTIPTTLTSQDGILTIGNWPGLSQYWPGKLSNIALWSVALTQANATEIYNQGVPGDISSLSPLVWWQLGSNSSFNTNWTCLNEGSVTGSNAVSANMTNSDIVDGVGYSASGLGTSSIDIKGDAPYSTANGLSENMDVLDRTTDVPS